MALAWCYTKWQVASTIIGVTIAWRSSTKTWTPGAPSCRPKLLAEIDKIRWEIRDPAA